MNEADVEHAIDWEFGMAFVIVLLKILALFLIPAIGYFFSSR